jgi:hypothetical protein
VCAGLYDGFSVYWGTIIILGIFAALNLCGLSESANVALLIFIAHIFTLTLLCATAFAYMAQVRTSPSYRRSLFIYIYYS